MNIIDILPDDKKTSWTTIFSIKRTTAGAESALTEYMKCEDALTVCRAILPDVTRAGVCVDELHNGCKILQVFFSQLDTPYCVLAGNVLGRVLGKNVDGVVFDKTMPSSPAELLNVAKHEQFSIDIDSELTGVRVGLSAKSRKKSLLELHEDNGHVGYVATCLICAMVKLTVPRLFSKMEPVREVRPAYLWHVDTMKVSCKSTQVCV